MWSGCLQTCRVWSGRLQTCRVWSGCLQTGRVWSGCLLTCRVWSGCLQTGRVWSGCLQTCRMWNGCLQTCRVWSGRLQTCRMWSGCLQTCRVWSGCPLMSTYLPSWALLNGPQKRCCKGDCRSRDSPATWNLHTEQRTVTPALQVQVWWHDCSKWLAAKVIQEACVIERVHFAFKSTEARWLIRDGDRGAGRGVGGTKEWRLDRGSRPKKTGETVDRRQNNGSVKEVSPRHCAATSALRNCCFNCRAGQSQRRIYPKWRGGGWREGSFTRGGGEGGG